ELDDRIATTWAKVIERDPKQPAAYIGLALAHSRAGRNTVAEATLEKGLLACDDSAELARARVRVRQATDVTGALDLIDRAVKARPKDLMLLEQLAETAMEAER